MTEERFCHHCGALQDDTLRPIPGHPGYHASVDGRIRGPRGWVEGSLNDRGYRQVSIQVREGHARKSPLVHSLVAKTFLGPRPKGFVVRHLNGDRLDNRAVNLAYGTYKQNGEDTVRHGASLVGSKNARAKLTEYDVKHIRSSPLSDRSLATRYGVHRVTISNIRNGKSWRHVK